MDGASSDEEDLAGFLRGLKSKYANLFPSDTPVQNADGEWDNSRGSVSPSTQALLTAEEGLLSGQEGEAEAGPKTTPVAGDAGLDPNGDSAPPMLSASSLLGPALQPQDDLRPLTSHLTSQPAPEWPAWNASTSHTNPLFVANAPGVMLDVQSRAHHAVTIDPLLTPLQQPPPIPPAHQHQQQQQQQVQDPSIAASEHDSSSLAGLQLADILAEHTLSWQADVQAALGAQYATMNAAHPEGAPAGALAGGSEQSAAGGDQQLPVQQLQLQQQQQQQQQHLEREHQHLQQHSDREGQQELRVEEPSLERTGGVEQATSIHSEITKLTSAALQQDPLLAQPSHHQSPPDPPHQTGSTLGQNKRAASPEGGSSRRRKWDYTGAAAALAPFPIHHHWGHPGPTDPPPAAAAAAAAAEAAGAAAGAAAAPFSPTTPPLQPGSTLPPMQGEAAGAGAGHAGAAASCSPTTPPLQADSTVLVMQGAHAGLGHAEEGGEDEGREADNLQGFARSSSLLKLPHGEDQQREEGGGLVMGPMSETHRADQHLWHGEAVQLFGGGTAGEPVLPVAGEDRWVLQGGVDSHEGEQQQVPLQGEAFQLFGRGVAEVSAAGAGEDGWVLQGGVEVLEGEQQHAVGWEDADQQQPYEQHEVYVPDLEEGGGGAHARGAGLGSAYHSLNQSFDESRYQSADEQSRAHSRAHSRGCESRDGGLEMFGQQGGVLLSDSGGEEGQASSGRGGLTGEDPGEGGRLSSCLEGVHGASVLEGGPPNLLRGDSGLLGAPPPEEVVGVAGGRGGIGDWAGELHPQGEVTFSADGLINAGGSLAGGGPLGPGMPEEATASTAAQPSVSRWWLDDGPATTPQDASEQPGVAQHPRVANPPYADLLAEPEAAPQPGVKDQPCIANPPYADLLAEPAAALQPGLAEPQNAALLPPGPRGPVDASGSALPEAAAQPDFAELPQTTALVDPVDVACHGEREASGDVGGAEASAPEVGAATAPTEVWAPEVGAEVPEVGDWAMGRGAGAEALAAAAAPAAPEAPEVGDWAMPRGAVTAEGGLVAGVGELLVSAEEWRQLNMDLQAAGFSMLPLQAVPVEAGAAAGPGLRTMHDTLMSVLHQYGRRHKLVSDLLAGMHAAARNEEKLQSALTEAARDSAAAQKAADKAQREVLEMQQQLLPRTKADFQAQVSKLRSEAAFLKDQLKDADARFSEKDAEAKSLSVTVASLQIASCQAGDSEAAGLRTKVSQLEALLRTRDKELERARHTLSTSAAGGSEELAAARERAFAGEDAAQRANAQAAQLRTKLAHLEQASRHRELELTSALSDTDAHLATVAGASVNAAERASVAEEGIRRAEAEAAQLRSKVASLEASLRDSKKHCTQLKEEAEGVRAAAYEELYRAEDEVRALKEEVGTRAARVTHLEHVLRARDREFTRLKEDRDAGRAAERERARVAEEVAVRVETELGACKQRCFTLEGAARTAQREARMLEDALKVNRGVEYDGSVKSLKAEEGARKVETDLANARSRIVQLESSLRSRDRDHDKLGRTIEALKQEAAEAAARGVRAEEAVSHLESAAAVSRSRTLSLEGALRVKEREIERLTRLSEAAKVAEANMSARLARTEDTVRKLEGDLAAGRVRCAQLESSVRSKELGLDKLAKALDAQRREEHDMTLQASRTDEAARRLDGDLAALRSRILGADNMLKAKQHELERGGRQLEAARAAEFEANAQKLQAEALSQRLETELGAARAHALGLENGARAHAKEVERLSRLLDMTRRSEFEMSVKQAQAEEAAFSLADELSNIAKRVSQIDGTLKLKDREITRLRKQADDEHASLANMALQRSSAEEAARTALEDAMATKQRAAAAEAATRARDREVSRLARQLSGLMGNDQEVATVRSQVEEVAAKLDADLVAANRRLVQLEGVLRSRDKEVERSQRSAEAARTAEATLTLRLSEAEDAVRKLEAEMAGMRAKLAQADSTTKARERQLERLERMLDSAKSEQLAAEGRRAEADESARRAAEDAAHARQRTVQAEGQLRGKEREVERLQRALDATQSSQVDAAMRIVQAEECTRAACEELAAARQHWAQLENRLHAREREVERLGKQLGQSKGAEYNTEAQRALTEETVRRLDAELVATKQRAAQLEGSLRGRDKDIDALQRQLDATKDAEALTSAHKARAEEACRKAETEGAAARTRLHQVEGQLRNKCKEVERAQKALEVADAEALSHAARTDEFMQQLDAGMMSLRHRTNQLHNALRSRDAEITKLRKALATARESGHTSEAERLQGKEAAQQLDAQLAGLRQRILHLEGAMRAKDREVDKVQREMAAARAAEAEVAARHAALEDAARKLDSEASLVRRHLAQATGSLKMSSQKCARVERALEGAREAEQAAYEQRTQAEAATRATEAEAAHLRQRLVRAESQCRAREREVSALQRRLEGARRDEHEAAAASLATEEAAHKVDADLVAMRAQLKAVEQSLHVRDEELLRLTRRLDATRGTESEMEAKASAVQEAFRVLDVELGSLKQRVVQMQSGLAAKDREIGRLVKALEASKAAELAGEVRQQDAEAACHALRDQLAAAKQRGVQLESGLRARNREIDKAHKATEGSQAAQNAAELRAAEAEECLRALEAEVALGQQRVAQAEAAWRVRDREVERLLRQLESRGGASALEFKDASDLAHKLQHELSTARAKLAASETSCRAKDAECLRLNRLLDASRTSEAGLDSRRAAAEEAARKAEAEAVAVRVRAAQAEGELRTLEAESNRLSAAIKLMESGAEDASGDKARREEAMRKLQYALSAAEQRASQLEAAVRAKERLVEAGQRALDNSRAEADKAGDALSRLQEAVQRLEGELASHRSRVIHMESAAKVKDREIERLSRAMQAARGEASGAEAAAGRDSSKLAEELKRLEAALQQTKVRITSLESSLATRDRELATLCSSEAGGRSLSEETLASAGQRAARAEEIARRSEMEAVQCKAKAVHLEHALRSREASMDKLRAALADKVVKEERQAARDKQVYARLRSVFAAHRADLQGKNAAGSVAAASRELRPVEIVGVYEQQREGLETQLVAARAEVRLLSEQLRDAQNMISIKDRSGGWRNPNADSDVHGKVLALEKRTAMAARELTAARAEGADALRGAERRVAEAERRAHMLAEENASMLAELQARPTVQDLRSAKREVDILERQLSKLKHGGGNSQNGSPQQQLGRAGTVAEGGELDMGLASSRASLSSRQRMRRDREVHRLGLRIVEDMSRAVLVDLLQDTCIELDVSDVTQLPGAAHKLARVVSAVPKMEAYIDDVCKAVYRDAGEELLPPELRGDGPKDPQKVLVVLRGWIASLHTAAQLSQVLTTLVDVLSSRAEPAVRSAGPPKTPADLVTAVQQLVAVEAQMLAGGSNMAAAELALAAAKPEDVVAGALHHFQNLFGCATLAGVIPAMNKVYMNITEQRNFMHALGSLLGLDKQGSPKAPKTPVTTTACFSAVQALVQQQQQQGSPHSPSSPSRSTPHQRLASPSASTPTALPPIPEGPEGQQAAQLEQIGGAEGILALQHLMALFDAPSLPQACKAGERLVARLKRLDVVLPRYQSVASQLYEVLRVRSLDEIVPATIILVDVAVRQQQQQQQYVMT